MKAALAFLTLPLLAQQTVDLRLAEQMHALGRLDASAVRCQSKPLDDPVVGAYVKRIGGQLVELLAERPFEYSFEVILGSDATEPMSFLGGFILIPARFFLTAHNEG